jgi:hypothetical protein
MEITIVAGFSAKWNMYINTRHETRNFCKIVYLLNGKDNQIRVDWSDKHVNVYCHPG